MPRNRLPPTANPPEEESESESEEDESDPEEEVEEEEKQVVAEGGGNRKEVESDEDSEEEEGEGEDPSEKTTSQVRGLDYGSDGDSGQTFPSPPVSAFVVKPNLKHEKKKEKKKKRVAESDLVKEKVEVKKAKKEKKGNGVVAEEDMVVEDKAKKSSGGLRIWGPEDELMILKGMMDYKEKTGVDFNSNLDAFYNFIKGSLNAVVDKSQLVNKIRKLKEKYRDNASKEANGEAPVFLKSHEAEAYELSKKIYGGGKVVSKGGSQGVKSKPKGKVEVNVAPIAPSVEMDNVLALPVPEVEVSKKEVIGGSAKVANRVRKVVPKMDLDEADVEMKDYTIPMPVMVDDFVVKKGLELAEKSKVDALNEKWTKYQLDAAELYAKRLDLVMEHTKLILDALKSNP